jgi:hypothetical protein
VGEDQPHARMAGAGLDGMPPERRDAAARVDHDRQAPLSGEREHRLEGRVVQRELLGPRMKLDPACSAFQGALDLGERLVMRIEPGEREQQAVALLRLPDDHLVRGRVALELVHREDERAGTDLLERPGQLGAAARVAVGVVEPDVGVCVERLDVRHRLAHGVEPREHARIGDHAG